MSTRLTIASKALEDALRSFSIEIAKVAGDSYEFRAVIEKTSYQDGATLAFYAKRDYESPVKGGSAEATWHELSAGERIGTRRISRCSSSAVRQSTVASQATRRW